MVVPVVQYGAHPYKRLQSQPTFSNELQCLFLHTSVNPEKGHIDNSLY